MQTSLPDTDITHQTQMSSPGTDTTHQIHPSAPDTIITHQIQTLRYRHHPPDTGITIWIQASPTRYRHHPPDTGITNWIQASPHRIQAPLIRYSHHPPGMVITHWIQASPTWHGQHPAGPGTPCPLPFHGQFLAPPRLSTFVLHALQDSHFSMQTNRHTSTQAPLHTRRISGILMLIDSCPASWIQDQLFYNDSPPPWTTHAHQWARRAPPPFPCPPPLPTHSPAGSLSPLNAPVSAIRNKYDF